LGKRGGLSGKFLRAVETLSSPGDVIELRPLKNGTTAAGYFDNAEALDREATKLDEQGYITHILHPSTRTSMP
jgi:hypothetical protein